ncbi:MAG: hypothetical protein ACK4RV_17080 [Caulobacter sp.]
MAEAIIRGVGAYEDLAASEPLTDLKPVLKADTGAAVRRIGRFIHLALIGAGRCLAGQTPPADTAVYFTTGSGDFEVTVEVMEHVFRDGFPPKPLSFINTVSNAACFYVAKQYGFSGRSACLGARHFGFEAALQLALLDIRTGAVRSALVGSADIVLTPVEVHRRRLGQPPDAPIAEAAHWLWLTAPDGSAPGERQGGVRQAAILPDREALMAWIAAQQIDPSSLILARGQWLGDDDFAELRRDLGDPAVFDYRAGRPYFDSQAAAAVGAFLATGEGGVLLHINGDPDGRYAVILAQR